MFSKLEEQLYVQEQQFYMSLGDLVKKQQDKIRQDIESKVPNFIQRLSVKYK